jgi:oligoribonuclease (3'-5' exoribonuclease)
MDVFELRRDVDETGVSGTGTVARGVVLDNGKVVLAWLTAHTSVAVYDSMDAVVAIHGHNGATRVVRTARLDFADVRAHGMNYVQDVCEGVHGCALSAGGNQKYLAQEREWYVQLFDEAEYASAGH